MISRALFLRPVSILYYYIIFIIIFVKFNYLNLIIQALEYLTANERELREYEFSEKQWQEFILIEDFLKLFHEVTTLMSGSTYPTLSLTIPLFNILVDHVEDTISSIEESNENQSHEDNIFVLDNESKNMIKEAAKACKEKLLKYYNKTNTTYLISTILDPRLKLDYYKEHDWDEDMINEIKQMLVYFLIYLIIYKLLINKFFFLDF